MISSEHLSRMFVEVADTLVDDFDLVEFLQKMADNAAEVSGAASVGLILAGPGHRLRFMAATNLSGRKLELLQLQNSEGPCLDCFRTGEPVVNANLHEAQDRWPMFARAAIDAGFQSVHAFPLRLRGETIGALNLFGREDAGFRVDDIGVVQALADVATIAILQERNITRSDELAEQLQIALNSRVVIEQAKGAMAQVDHISLDEAFALLRQEARSTHQRLVDVAQAFLDRHQYGR
jgi:GAF domain-containing protein